MEIDAEKTGIHWSGCSITTEEKALPKWKHMLRDFQIERRQLRVVADGVGIDRMRRLAVAWVVDRISGAVVGSGNLPVKSW